MRRSALALSSMPLTPRTRRLGAPLALLVACACGMLGCGPAPAVQTQPSITHDPEKIAAKVQADFDALGPHVLTYVERYHVLPERLPDLRDTPDGQPLIDKIPLDPWRVPYVLRRLDEDVVVLTAGPDLIIGSQDDQSVRISFEGVPTPPEPAPAPADETDAPQQD